MARKPRKKAEPSPEEKLTAASVTLATFLSNNPAASLEYMDEPYNHVAVKNPWGDESIGLLPVRTEVIDSLNAVYLPERFTALWHIEAKLFEIIFTADPLPPLWSDLPIRAFDFVHRGKTYKCKFAEASNNLSMLATVAMPLRPTRTSYRNLMSFQRYYFAKANVGDYKVQDNAVPYSFYIEGLEWDENVIVDLCHHLNFYMTYYDNMSPVIVIHTPESETAASAQVTRFPFNEFPKTLTSRELDENLIHFWIASRDGDPVRRFIYNFQILEYAANFYIDDGIRRTVRRNLLSPNALDNIDTLTQKVIEALSENRMQDAQKLEAMLRNTVDHQVIWREISNNSAFFAAATQFEGGFTQDALIKIGWGVDDFHTGWIPIFPNAIRSIRNALSHGREQRTGGVILPTTENFSRLQAWVPLVAAAAREVMVYRGVM